MIDYKHLTRESFLKEEIYEQVWAIPDPMEQAAVICTLSDLAKELGAKQHFDRMLRASKKLRQAYGQAAGGGYTEFSGDYPKLRCGGWIADDSGIRILTNLGEKLACSHPILPTAVLVNAQTGYMKVVLAYRIRQRWREIIADMETVSSNNKIVALSRYGIRVSSENARALVQYLTDVIGMNEKQIPERMSTGKLGWLDRTTFVPYDESVIFDNDDALSGAWKAVRSHGSCARWLELVRAGAVAGAGARWLELVRAGAVAGAGARRPGERADGACAVPCGLVRQPAAANLPRAAVYRQHLRQDRDGKDRGADAGLLGVGGPCGGTILHPRQGERGRARGAA